MPHVTYRLFQRVGMVAVVVLVVVMVVVVVVCGVVVVRVQGGVEQKIDCLGT